MCVCDLELIKVEIELNTFFLFELFIILQRAAVTILFNLHKIQTLSI